MSKFGGKNSIPDLNCHNYKKNTRIWDEKSKILKLSVKIVRKKVKFSYKVKNFEVNS